jgi:hypothetical protein
VRLEQAQAIVAALDLLSDDVTAEQRLHAERHLLEQAASHDARELRILGRRLFEVLDPDEADRKEGEALEAEERRARQVAHLSMRSRGDGTVEGRFRISELHAAMLSKAVQALTAPRRLRPECRVDAEGKKVPYSTLLGQGLMELVEHLPTEKIGNAGGTAATVVVTLSLEKLLTGIGAATLDDGTRISASEARRLACEAGVIPLVLGGDSQPLDVGRKRRLHTEHQRIVLAHRDGGCKAETCDRPPAWSECHHVRPWSAGGATSVGAGEMFCSFHHHLMHDTRYDTSRLPSGRVRFRLRQ